RNRQPAHAPAPPVRTEAFEQTVASADRRVDEVYDRRRIRKALDEPGDDGSCPTNFTHGEGQAGSAERQVPRPEEPTAHQAGNIGIGPVYERRGAYDPRFDPELRSLGRDNALRFGFSPSVRPELSCLRIGEWGPLILAFPGGTGRAQDRETTHVHEL